MYNNAYTQLGNPNAALGREPDYTQQIQLPRSVQVRDAGLFTGMFWLGRWTLEQAVQQDDYLIPSWNILSENGFENPAYAKCVSLMCELVMNDNVPDSRFVDDAVMPVLEMDAAVRWFDNQQLAEQILPPNMAQRAQKWIQHANRFRSQSQPQNNWGQQQNNWGQQQGGFGRQQQGSWGQQSGGFRTSAGASAWGNQQQAPGGRSGFFDQGQKNVPSSVNQAGVRTTTSALERTNSYQGNQEPQSEGWKSRSAESARGGWGGKSTQQAQRERNAAPSTNPLDAVLPQGEQEWNVDSNQEAGAVGDSTMTHEVNVADTHIGGGFGTPVAEIECPVLRCFAGNIFGESLPGELLLTGKDGGKTVIVAPAGQTDIPTTREDSGLTDKLAYDADTALVDYIYADYEKEAIASRTVAIDNKDGKMDYSKHVLGGPVQVQDSDKPHHVELAAMVKPTNRVAEVGMVTPHTKGIDGSVIAYNAVDGTEAMASFLKAQGAKVDKSIEQYNKQVIPFVTDKTFESDILHEMGELKADQYDEYVEKLKQLPRAMYLEVAGNIFGDVQNALTGQLDAGLTLDSFEDIADVREFLVTNRSETLASLWDEVLGCIMRNNIRLVSDGNRISALEALGDAAPKETDNLVLLERETYELVLPYTLTELNITATDEDFFYVQDSSHADLHTVIKEVFERLVKTNISCFTLRTADGVCYRINKLKIMAKTYTFSKVK